MSKAKNKLGKLAAVAALGLGALTAQAQTINGDVNGTVLPGCTLFNTRNLSFNMSTVAGRVATAQADINILCSPNLIYTIAAESNFRQYVSTAGENINVRAYTNSEMTNQITTVGISAVGNGAVETHTVFLKAESALGPDFGQGRVLTRDGTFSGTFNFILSF